MKLSTNLLDSTRVSKGSATDIMFLFINTGAPLCRGHWHHLVPLPLCYWRWHLNLAPSPLYHQHLLVRLPLRHWRPSSPFLSSHSVKPASVSRQLVVSKQNQCQSGLFYGRHPVGRSSTNPSSLLPIGPEGDHVDTYLAPYSGLEVKTRQSRTTLEPKKSYNC